MVEVTACAVCRTDLQIVEGDLTARRLPVVPGHQAVGRVLAVGAGVIDRVPGDRVGVAWLAETCGVCRFCTTARENLCEQARFTGWDRDGGYATRLVARADFTLRHSRRVRRRRRRPTAVRRRDRLPVAQGLRHPTGWPARAVRLRRLRPARPPGGGAPGMRGVRRHPVGRPSGARCAKMGAVWAGAYDDPPPVPLDAAITFAPSGDVVVAALRAVDRGGTVAVNAIHLDRIPEFPYESLWWERRLRSVANFTRARRPGVPRPRRRGAGPHRGHRVPARRRQRSPRRPGRRPGGRCRRARQLSDSQGERSRSRRDEGGSALDGATAAAVGGEHRRPDQQHHEAEPGELIHVGAGGRELGSGGGGTAAAPARSRRRGSSRPLGG